MLLLAAAAVATAPLPEITISPPFVPPPHSTAKCPRADSYVAGAQGRYDGKPLMPRKLTELPPANMYVAVMRVNGQGCLDPIIVKYNVGR